MKSFETNFFYFIPSAKFKASQLTLLGVLLLYGSLLISTKANAQVAVTLTAGSVYDDNIFLESGDAISTAQDSEGNPAVDSEGNPIVLPQFQNGEEDDDFITNVALRVSAPIRLSRHIKSAFDAKVGALIFGTQSEESRMLFDSHISLEPKETLLPRPLTASIKSVLSSQSKEIAVADGSASRTAHTHDAYISFGAEKVRISNSLSTDVSYTFLRHDFFDSLTFSNSDESREVTGSDYFSNGVNASLNYPLSSILTITPSFSGRFLTFTDVGNADQDKRDFDRAEYSYFLSTQLKPLSSLSLSARAGQDFSRFSRDTIRSTSLDPLTQETITTLVSREKSQSSFVFGLSAFYQPLETLQLSTFISQSSGVDISGERILTRSYSANINQRVTKRISFAVSGRFLQFDNNETIEDSTERLEVTTSAKFSLTESISLNLGWNYADQESDEIPASSQERTNVDGEDYTSHRVFVTLNTGLLLSTN